jgi:hypothetical protein
MVEACGTTAPTPSVSRIVRPLSWGVLGDRGERARPGQYRARPQQQDREHIGAYPPGLARVGNLAQRVGQGQRRGWGPLAVESDLRVIEGGNDRGPVQCGHGLPDAIKDSDTLMITPSPCPSS